MKGKHMKDNQVNKSVRTRPQLTVTISEGLHHQLELEVARQCRPRSWVVEELLADGLRAAKGKN